MNTPLFSYLQSILTSIPAHFTGSERAFTTHVLRALIWKTYCEADEPTPDDMLSELFWEHRQSAKTRSLGEQDPTLLADIHEAFNHIVPSPSPLPLLGSYIQGDHLASSTAPIYDADTQRFHFLHEKEAWGDEQPSPAVCAFFASHEQWHHWRDIPYALLKACSDYLDKLPQQSFYEVLPAQLAASLTCDTDDSCCSHIVSSLTLDPQYYTESKKEYAAALNDQQRAVVLRNVNLYRAARPLWNMHRLLPWECPLYLVQQEHQRVIHWLRARYPELGERALPSEPHIERIRAAIPSAWSSYDREELEHFLDCLTDRLLRPLAERGEPKSWDALPAQQQDLLRQIDEAFAEVSDEGCRRLLLTGETADEGICDESMEIFLSSHEQRGDWHDLPLAWISACECSLSHVDAVGYRFLLPAFLRADFIVDFTTDMSIKLAASSEKNLLDYQLGQSRLLNEQQREVVQNYMHYRRCDPDWYSQDYLLAWEMRDYLAQEEHQTPQAWLRARYPEIYYTSS